MSQIPEQFQKGYKIPFQTQSTVPGQQHKLNPTPIDDITADGKPYKAAGKLEGRVAIVTGADSGIGRAVATLFGTSSLLSEAIVSARSLTSASLALEGADLTLHATKSEETDLKDVEQIIKEKTGGKCKVNVVFADLRGEDACKHLVQAHLDAFGGKLDTLCVFIIKQLEPG